MLAVNFQSFKLSLIILAIIPAVVSGSVILLILTGTTLNIQSYMGMIMAVGIAVSNAILFVTNAEFYRRKASSTGWAITGAHNRIRPILMTSMAMIAGMIPMAIGFGQGGDQTAPLAIAVIGGLSFSAISTLIFLPIIYSRVIGDKPYINPSLDPEDPESIHYSPSKIS